MNDVYMWVPKNRMEPSHPVSVVDSRKGNSFKLDNGWVVNSFGHSEGTKMMPGGKLIEIEEAKEALMRDLIATFPLLTVRKRDGHLMVAEIETEALHGQKIFNYDPYDVSGDGTYPDGVHVAFEMWIMGRGFYLERQDESWWIPTPRPSIAEVAEWNAQLARSGRTAQFDPNEIPF